MNLVGEPKFSKKWGCTGRKTTLDRVFQILKVVVNYLYVTLKQNLMGMSLSLMILRGGLMLMIFHNIEDRVANKFMR